MSGYRTTDGGGVAPLKKVGPSLAPIHKKLVPPLIIIIVVSYQQVIDT